MPKVESFGYICVADIMSLAAVGSESHYFGWNNAR